MFKLAKPEEIGQFLTQCVMQHYESQRRFCKIWLEQEGLVADDATLQKRSNKFSQMKNGKKGVQTEDLPIICSLLNLSCEELLSAGTSRPAVEGRLNNYVVALSDDPEVWETYIQLPEAPILHADEYGKTVLDYAIEYQKLDFIEYLWEKGYIWFDDGREEGQLCFGFGAGSSISAKDHVQKSDYYFLPQLEQVDLRGRLAALAVEQNRLSLLQALRANIIPDYYHPGFCMNNLPLMCRNFPEEWDTQQNYSRNIYGYYQEGVLQAIGRSTDEIVDYFTEPVVIPEITEYRDGLPRTRELTYFCLSQLLDQLVEAEHPFAGKALDRAIAYSKQTENLVRQQLERNIQAESPRHAYGEPGTPYSSDGRAAAIKAIFSDAQLHCDTELNLVRVQSCAREEPGWQHLVRNLIHVTAATENQQLQEKIRELNAYYERIIHIQDEFLPAEEG